MKNNIFRKNQFLKWWTIEGKIECTAGALLLIILILFWNNLLIEGITGIIVAIWGFAKIYFRRDQWLFLIVLSTWALTQGLAALIKYLNS